MLKKLILFILSCLFISSSFALSGENIATGNNCDNYDFKIVGNSITKIGVQNHYGIENFTGNAGWEIKKNNKVVFSFTGIIFNYNFKTAGKVDLLTKINYKNCKLSLEKKVHIYDKIILLVKDGKVSFVPTNQLEEKNIYFKSFSFNELKNNKFLLENADYIIIDQDNVIDFFSSIDKKLLYNKKFILLIGSFKGFYSKFIIPYVKNISQNNIYIYDKNDFLNVLETIYENKQLDKTKLFVSSSVGDKIYFPLSYFLNKLIANGVSIESIGLVLLALFGIIVIAIFRQVIGFSVFGVYTPLLFTILLIVVGYKIALLLFLLSILSNIFTYFITKKIYILYSSKIALNYILYVIISIISIGLLIKYKFISFDTINNTVVLSFFVMPLLSKSLIKEETSIFSKSFWLFLFEFIFIVGVLLLIFNLDSLKYILIAYPDLLWLFVIFTILIGRFSGLQLLEYIRFYPLIKKGIYEEE